jgi:hypothetical protein
MTKSADYLESLVRTLPADVPKPQQRMRVKTSNHWGVAKSMIVATTPKAKRSTWRGQQHRRVSKNR